MPPQRLKKRLKAPGHNAAQSRSLDLHPTYSRRSLDLRGWGGANEADLDALDRALAAHAASLRSGPTASIGEIARQVPGGLAGTVGSPRRVYLPTMARPSARSGNLPAEARSFVGRRRELAELRKKLGGARLVSLVGAGGIGKSRLAVRSATDLGRGFRDGVWLVELAEIRDPELVVSAVLAALDLRNQSASEPAARIRSYLQDKELLLVLDNCEHLLEEVAHLVMDLMKFAPGVRVLATSREPLSLPDEHVIPVPPLDLPSEDATEPLARVRQNEAVALFTDRADAASGEFELTASNRSAVVDICRRLDGLPLAIELAAVRTRVLSVEQILDRLDDRFGLLAGGNRAALPRHQTLRTTIDWSYDLLSANERIFMRRLCVFAGRFMFEDAESVCASEDAPATPALELLSSLVEKSLVMKEDAKGKACYRLHETMREYAVLQLREAGEEAKVEERFSVYYWSTCLQAMPNARYRLLEWLDWMALEIDNVRSVLRRCLVRGDLARGTDLATSAGWFWVTRASSEGARWLDELLRAGQANPGMAAWAYFMRGFLAVLQADPASARPALARGVALAREEGKLVALAHSLSMGAIAERMSGDRASAAKLLEEAGTVVAQLADVDVRIALLQARTLIGFFDGDVETMRTAALEGARLGRESGDLYSLEMMTMNLGFAALIAGDPAESKPHFVDALRIADQLDDRVAQYALLDGLGCVAASTGQARLAARLIGAAETLRTSTGASVIAILVPLLAVAETSAVASMGAAKFEAEVNAGKASRRDATIRLALGQPAHLGEAAGDGEATSAPLGKREADVARLVADGLSNKRIGARLFISERTVDGHVRSILNKLGFNSRAQIAAWMTSGR